MGFKEELDKNGVAIIPNVFTKDEMEKLRTEAYKALDTANPRYPHRYVEYSPTGSPALMFFPALCNEYMDSLRTDKRLVSIVKDILGNNVKQLNNQFYFRHGKDKDSFAWHTDRRFRANEHIYPNIGQGYLQTAIIVDNWTDENGAVEYIFGSHKQNFKELPNLRGFERMGLQGTKVYPKCGDVAIWSVLVVHGSEENTSDASRSYYMNGFAKAESAKEFPYYLVNGEVVPLDATQIP